MAVDENSLRTIHAAGWKMALALTGGGSGAIAALLQTPGASKSVLEACVPYANAALDLWLGGRPEHYCSSRTARAMAGTAFDRARRLAGPDADVTRLAGVGCTASLASDRPKKGPHRLHVAVQTADRTQVAEVTLNKGARSRREEEKIASQEVLHTLAEAIGLPDLFPLDLTANDRRDAQIAIAPVEWQEIYLGQTRLAPARPGAGPPQASPRRVVFPGAFDPRHVGHRQMAELAAQRLGLPVEHEISIANVDKLSLDYLDLQERTGQFAADEPLWFTRAPTFVEKAGIFPNTTFVVGADTIDRIANCKYYGHDQAALDRALAELAQKNSRFLVFARQTRDGLHSLDNARLPPPLRALCDEVPVEQFRQDISSTEIRQRREQTAE